MTSAAIKVEGLTKTFTSQTHGLKKIKALDGMDLEVFEGEILGILGPNGAGKTTFLNILSTLLIPDLGTVEILGLPLVQGNYDALRSLLNMSSGYPNYPWSLTVEENLRFYGRLYGLSSRKLNQRIKDLVEMFELGDFARRRFDELSSGTKQRLSLAKALINEPKIIFLDEPTVGLDPDVAIKTREIIMDIFNKSKVTILLTTHNMKEAELMCRRIAFIKQGKLLKLATPDEFKRAQGKEDLEEVFIELAHGKTDDVSSPPLSPPTRGGELMKNRSRSLPLVGRVREGVQLPLFTSKYFKEETRTVSTSSLNINKGKLGLITGWLKRCYAFSYRNFLFAIRNAFAFAELIFWPVVSLLSIGLLGSYLELQEKALAFVLTGAIAGGVLQVAQLDVAYSLLYEIWSKSMKHTLLTPVGVSEHLFGSWLIGILRGSAIFALLGLSAIYLFGFRFPPLGVTVVFLSGIFGSALLLGMLVSVLILIFGQKAEITAWMFAYLFMLLCGIYYPVATLPKFFYCLAQLVPITYFLEYFRQSFGFSSGLSHLLAKGFGLIFLYLCFGMMVLKWAFHQARKKGIIVRLSE